MLNANCALCVANLGLVLKMHAKGGVPLSHLTYELAAVSLTSAYIKHRFAMRRLTQYTF